MYCNYGVLLTVVILQGKINGDVVLIDRTSSFHKIQNLVLVKTFVTPMFKNPPWTAEHVSNWVWAKTQKEHKWKRQIFWPSSVSHRRVQVYCRIIWATDVLKLYHRTVWAIKGALGYYRTVWAIEVFKFTIYRRGAWAIEVLKFVVERYGP